MATAVKVISKHEETRHNFEEAVALTGSGWFHHKLLILSGLCLISMVFETMSASFIAPAARCDFEMTSGEKGLLNAILYIGMIVSSHFWGFMADTQGRRKVLLITLCADFLCTIIATFMPTLYLYMMMRFLSGFFICGPSAVVFAYLGEFHADKTRGRATLWVCAFMSLGTIAQPGVAWAVLPQDWTFYLGSLKLNSWRLFVFLGGVPAILTALLMWLLLPESPKFLMAVGKQKEALSVLQQMYAINSGSSRDSYPVNELHMDTYLDSKPTHSNKSIIGAIKFMWNQTYPLFVKPYLTTTVVACIVQFGLYSSTSGFYLWVPDLLNRVAQHETLFPNKSASMCEAIDTMVRYNFTTAEETVECNSSLTEASFLNPLIMSAVSSAAFILIGYLLVYIPKKTIIGVNLVLSAICGIAMLWAGSSLELLALPGLYVIFAGTTVSVVNSVVIEAIPTQLRAMAICLSLCMGRLGTSVTTILLGYLIDLNCSAAIITISCCVLVCGLLSWFLPSSKAD